MYKLLLVQRNGFGIMEAIIYSYPLYKGEDIMEYNIMENDFDEATDLLLDHSIDNLLKHSKNKSKFQKTVFFTSSGGMDKSDYTSKSLRRSCFAQKHFYETKFINSAAAGSHFSECSFDACKLQNANFQECTFSNGLMKNNSEENVIQSCNFNNSLFSDGFCIDDVVFQHSVFQGTAFVDSIIKNTTFFSCTLQDAQFFNTQLENVRFNDLNIDYASFNNVHMCNVILPFSQICYSFGLLPYLMTTQDEVYITSVANEKGNISITEFLDLLSDFEVYYSETREFFPLANIYLSKNELTKARNAIMKGILLAINNCDLRQIKYLSKLIYTYPVFDFHQRKQIYDYINAHISFHDMNSGLLYKYNVYKNEIRSFLLDNNRSGIVTCEIDILTDVYPEDSQKLGMILSVLEQIIEQNKSEKGEHNILCRHNSAEEILITIQDIYQALTVIIPTIYSVILGAMILEEKWNTRKKDQVELKYATELKELEIREKRMEIESKELQLIKEKAEYIAWQNKQLQDKNRIPNEILRRNITDNAIQVKEIHHITYGDIPQEIDKRILQYSQKAAL